VNCYKVVREIKGKLVSPWVEPGHKIIYRPNQWVSSPTEDLKWIFAWTRPDDAERWVEDLCLPGQDNLQIWWADLNNPQTESIAVAHLACDIELFLRGEAYTHVVSPMKHNITYGDALKLEVRIR
jgi:hypothetical protein